MRQPEFFIRISEDDGNFFCEFTDSLNYWEISIARSEKAALRKAARRLRKLADEADGMANHQQK